MGPNLRAWGGGLETKVEAMRDIVEVEEEAMGEYEWRARSGFSQHDEHRPKSRAQREMTMCGPRQRCNWCSCSNWWIVYRDLLWDHHPLKGGASKAIGVSEDMVETTTSNADVEATLVLGSFGHMAPPLPRWSQAKRHDFFGEFASFHLRLWIFYSIIEDGRKGTNTPNPHPLVDGTTTPLPNPHLSPIPAPNPNLQDQRSLPSPNWFAISTPPIVPRLISSEQSISREGEIMSDGSFFKVKDQKSNILLNKNQQYSKSHKRWGYFSYFSYFINNIRA